MNASFVASKDQIDIFVSNQGGGALAEFCAGFLWRILGDERVWIAGISGTSKGAGNAKAVHDGLEKGLEQGSKKLARQYSRDNLMLQRNHAIAMQEKHLPLWYDTHDAFFSMMPNGFRELFLGYAKVMSGRKQTTPFLEFLQTLYDRPEYHKPAGNNSKIICAVNTTIVPAGTNHFDRERTTEAIHFTHDMPHQQRIITTAASGCLNFSQAVRLNGQSHFDGAYQNALPDPEYFANYCKKKGWAFLGVLSRQTGSYSTKNEALGSENWMRAFFNELADRARDHIENHHSTLPQKFIEPDYHEPDGRGMLSKEMRFDARSMRTRWDAGVAAAEKLLCEPNLRAAFSHDGRMKPSRRHGRTPQIGHARVG